MAATVAFGRVHFYLLAKIVKCVLLSNDEVFHDQSDAVHV